MEAERLRLGAGRLRLGVERLRIAGESQPPGGVHCAPMAQQRRTSVLLRMLSLWPPYLGAGIRVRPSADLRTFDVRMRLRWWNRNYVNTHFGGSLYSMCDPFFMLILIQALGRGYVVWDKAATIRFRRPGKGTVRATFHIPQEKVDEIRAAADRGEKIEPVFTVEVRDEQGEVVAEVEKLLYVRLAERLAKPLGGG
jgi:acyl-coenzyme A thioesterase PaaI-like protein